VSLVTAEVDVTVIRSWLGHASLDTTNIYARANVEAKRKLWKKWTGLPDPPSLHAGTRGGADGVARLALNRLIITR